MSAAEPQARDTTEPPLRPPKPSVDVPVGLAFIVGGVYVALAYGKGEANWAFLLLGAGLAAGGWVSVAYGLGLGRRVAEQFSIACITLALNYWIFMAGLEWLRSVGGARGPMFARVAVAAVDLYLVLWIVAAVLRIEQRRPAALIGAILLAIGLQAAGVLDRIGYSSRLLPPITSGVLAAYRREARDPEVPLQDYAGTWVVEAGPRYGTAWVKRIAIRFDAGKPRATLWRGCGSGECEAGSYAGTVEARSAGKAQAVHFAGHTDGKDWIVSLRPMTYGRMWLQEQRIRGTDHSTREAQDPTVKRVAQ